MNPNKDNGISWQRLIVESRGATRYIKIYFEIYVEIYFEIYVEIYLNSLRNSIESMMFDEIIENSKEAALKFGLSETLTINRK